jgi:hypothetical protein
MKHIIWSVITLIIIFVINFGLTSWLHAEFMEYAFLTGIVITAILWFFNSSGGATSNALRLETQARTGIKMEAEKAKFKPRAAFFTALGYTILMGIVTILYYFV